MPTNEWDYLVLGLRHRLGALTDEGAPIFHGFVWSNRALCCGDLLSAYSSGNLATYKLITVIAQRHTSDVYKVEATLVSLSEQAST